MAVAKWLRIGFRPFTGAALAVTLPAAIAASLALGLASASSATPSDPALRTQEGARLKGAPTSAAWESTLGFPGLAFVPGKAAAAARLIPVADMPPRPLLLETGEETPVASPLPDRTPLLDLAARFSDAAPRFEAAGDAALRRGTSLGATSIVAGLPLAGH